MIILKVTKNQDFTLSLKYTGLEKPQKERGKIDPPVVLGLKLTTFPRNSYIVYGQFYHFYNADITLKYCKFYSTFYFWIMFRFYKMV